MPDQTDKSPELKRTLGPLMLWGLGVGYVISGNYFGWNLGLAEGGTLGLAIATFFVIIMYITFTFGYTELACAIPKAGGPKPADRRHGARGSRTPARAIRQSVPSEPHAAGNRVELRMPIDLVGRRIKEHRTVLRSAGDDRFRRHHPKAGATTPRIGVAGVLQGHRGVRSVQAADVFVRLPGFFLRENLPKRHGCLGFGGRVGFHSSAQLTGCLAA